MKIEAWLRTNFGGLPGEQSDQLLRLLRQTFGATVTIIDGKIGNQSRDYLVLLIQLRSPNIQVVVKLAGHDAPILCPFERTAFLHHLVATQTTLAMPEILAVDTTDRQWPWRYLIKTFIPGVEWAVIRSQMSQGERKIAAHQIGQAVAQLHGVCFPSFGELTEYGAVKGDTSLLIALETRAYSLIKRPHLCDLFCLC